MNLSAQNSVVAVDDFYSTSLNTDVTMDVIANDFDPEGDVFFLFGVVSFPTNGTIDLNSDFTIDYIPNLDFCGTDQFIYIISDVNGAVDTATVDIDVSCDVQENSPPYAGADVDICAIPIVTNTVCISPSDPDGDDVSICAFDVLFDCTVEIISDTCMQFAALPGTFGINELQIIVCDSGDPMLTDTMSFFINLDCNEPIMQEDVIVISENWATLNGNDIDINNNTIVFDPLLNDSELCNYNLEVDLLANGPFQGTATIVSGMIEYTVNEDYSGTDQFQYFACNECGECSFSTILINVLPPCIEEYNFCVEENVNTTVCVDLCEADFEINTVTSAQGTIISVINETCFSYAAGPSGSEILSLDAVDSDGNAISASLNMDVQLSCSNLVAANDTAFVSPGVQSIIDVLSNDTNVSGNLPVTISSPVNGIVTVNIDGTIAYTPNAGFEGLETIEYELCDDSGNCEQATLIIIVLGNQEPIAVDDSAFTLINTPVQIDVLENDTDPEGDGLSVNSIGMPSNGTAIIFNDGIIYTPNMGYVGLDFMDYELCDVNGNCDQGYILIIIADEELNLPPDFANTPLQYSGALADTLIFCYSADDPEGEEVSYHIDAENVVGNYTIDSTSQCIEYYVEGIMSLVDIFEISACDENDNCSTIDVSFETLEMAENIMAEDDILSFDHSDSIYIDVLTNDILSTDYTVELLDGISSGYLELIDDSFVYIPFDELNSIDSFTYVICNSTGICDTAEATIMIGPLIAINDTVHLYSSSPVNISVLDNDINQIPILLNEVSNSGVGSVSFDSSTGIVTYENFDYANDLLTYRISDQILGALSAEAQIVIINHNDEIDCSEQPNSFTPNGDGVNDMFTLNNPAQCFPDATFTIFNRWGELVYSSEIEDIDEGWNGEEMNLNIPVSAGTYYYTIQSSSNLLKSGFLQLIK